jgi:predicted transcriptional regulator
MNTPDDPDLQTPRGANYDRWFLCEVNKGIAAADRGKFVKYLDVGKLIDERCHD